MKFQAIKGVRDILPPESALWNRVEQAAREVFGTYGYGEIRLPIIENIELFARSVGTETDIVRKEMFSFEEYGFTPLDTIRRNIVSLVPIDHTRYFRKADPQVPVETFMTALESALSEGEISRTPEVLSALDDIPLYLNQLKRELQKAESEQSDIDVRAYWSSIQRAVQNTRLGDQICLRPEATASAVRAYIGHGMQVRPGNTKLCYMGPMFRRERPQKGRYRQFYQIGAELLGTSDAPAIDAEVIEMLLAFFERINLKGATLYINSIGDQTCRSAYIAKLHGELRKAKDQLGADSQ